MGLESAKTDLKWAIVGRYPYRLIHALAEDQVLWIRYAAALTERPLRVWQDVGVGPWPSVGATDGDPYGHSWRRLNQRRIDVVIEYPDRVDLVEVHRSPAAASVGRLLHYRKLWQMDDPAKKPVRLVLVASFPEGAIAEICQDAGISYVVV